MRFSKTTKGKIKTYAFTALKTLFSLVKNFGITLASSFNKEIPIASITPQIFSTYFTEVPWIAVFLMHRKNARSKDRSKFDLRLKRQI